MLVDAVTASVAVVLTYFLNPRNFEDAIASQLWWLILVAGVLAVMVFSLAGLYRTILRFAGARFFLKVIFSSVIVTAVLAAITFGYLRSVELNFPRSSTITFAMLLSVGTACSRLFARYYIEHKANKNRERVLIYGAGEGGHQLFSAIRYGGQYSPVAFIDDNKKNQGKSIHGLLVYGYSSIEKLIKTKNVTTVLLAMPGMSHSDRAKIIEKLQKLNVKIQSTPNLTDWITNKAVLSELHNLSIEDLMSRTPVEVNEELASRCITGKSVFISGAGGSIGSELCRQVLVRKPNTIVLYELSESSLFYIQQELLKRLENIDAKIKIVAVLGSVLDSTRLRSVLSKFKVDSVFHTAAYKHVPMIEENAIEGIRNNIIGTKRLVESCVWANVRNLVIISTDKAVRPTNLMGATKRFAELVVQTIAKDSQSMRTCLVRFGNVLGSSGSVVPIFREQIKSGGPVTVTHKDMKRYFMTIPEASELVLQAGGMANDSEIFVLDMGEPEFIVDLARRMISGAGLTEKTDDNPNGDILIKFTKPRPGEKMFEELSYDNKLEKTSHEMIHKSNEGTVDLEEIKELVDLLEKAVDNRDDEKMLELVCKAVPEYVLSEQLRTNVNPYAVSTSIEKKSTHEASRPPQAID